jgi:hypothetical protein
MSGARPVGDLIARATSTRLPDEVPEVRPESPAPAPVPSLTEIPPEVSPKPVLRRFDFMLDAETRDAIKEVARESDARVRGRRGKGMELSTAGIVRAALMEMLADSKLRAKVQRRAEEEWKTITAEARKTGKGE